MGADPIVMFHALAGFWFFAMGAVVGSFVNVCVYRIPWEKSIFWPGSHCPGCLSPIRARDNVPILGWLWLRGRCRACQRRISPRYPLIEALVGTLFAATYVYDVVLNAPRLLEPAAFVRMAYHDVLIALLVIATFIDYDYFLIPDQVTVTGMVLGLTLGAIFPDVRPDPNAASTALGGLWQGLLGWAVGGGLVWAVRILAGMVFRREAMGFGDVTLMAMAGSFLGWQAAVLTFFLAPFFGLAHALWKLARLAVKVVFRRKITGADREVPFGPYLSMAALTLLFTWSKLWPGWAAPLFGTMGELVAFFAGSSP